MTEQLEITAELYIIYVRTTAEVCKVSLLIAGNRSIFQLRDQIQLVLIILEHLQSLFLGNLLTDDLLAGLCNLLHFLLNRCDILVTDYVIAKVYVIVKAFCNNRSYPELCLWVQVLDCLCHQMGTGVVQCF